MGNWVKCEQSGILDLHGSQSLFLLYRTLGKFLLFSPKEDIREVSVIWVAFITFILAGSLIIIGFLYPILNKFPTYGDSEINHIHRIGVICRLYLFGCLFGMIAICPVNVFIYKNFVEKNTFLLREGPFFF